MVMLVVPSVHVGEWAYVPCNRAFGRGSGYILRTPHIHYSIHLSFTHNQQTHSYIHRHTLSVTAKFIHNVHRTCAQNQQTHSCIHQHSVNIHCHKQQSLLVFSLTYTGTAYLQSREWMFRWCFDECGWLYAVQIICERCMFHWMLLMVECISMICEWLLHHLTYIKHTPNLPWRYTQVFC